MNRWRIITLSKTTLVSVPPSKRARGGYEQERIIFWDVNGNGRLDAGDKKFLFHTIVKPSSDPVSGCLTGCPTEVMGLQILERGVSGADIRAYGRRFQALVKRGRAQRAWMGAIPAIARGNCYAYTTGMLPMPVKVIFNPALTRATKLRVTKAFQRLRIPRTKVIDPSSCRAIDARYALPRPDVELKTLPVRLTFGGIVHSVWLAELMKTYAFRLLLPYGARRMTASYLFQGARYLHLSP